MAEDDGRGAGRAGNDGRAQEHDPLRTLKALAEIVAILRRLRENAAAASEPATPPNHRPADEP